MILGIAVSRVVDRTNKDHVFEYTCEVMSLRLLFLNFRDAIIRKVMVKE